MAAPARFRTFVLKKARENLAINNHGTAFSHYLLAIKIDHDLSSEILDEFVLCMCHWTDLLCCLGQQDDVTLAFSQARAVCSFSDTLMCALGEQALRYNLHMYHTFLLPLSLHNVEECPRCMLVFISPNWPKQKMDVKLISNDLIYGDQIYLG